MRTGLLGYFLFRRSHNIKEKEIWDDFPYSFKILFHDGGFGVKFFMDLPHYKLEIAEGSEIMDPMLMDEPQTHEGLIFCLIIRGVEVKAECLFNNSFRAANRLWFHLCGSGPSLVGTYILCKVRQGLNSDGGVKLVVNVELI